MTATWRAELLAARLVMLIDVAGVSARALDELCRRVRPHGGMAMVRTAPPPC